MTKVNLLIIFIQLFSDTVHSLPNLTKKIRDNLPRIQVLIHPFMMIKKFASIETEIKSIESYPSSYHQGM